MEFIYPGMVVELRCHKFFEGNKNELIVKLAMQYPEHGLLVSG